MLRDDRSIGIVQEKIDAKVRLYLWETTDDDCAAGVSEIADHYGYPREVIASSLVRLESRGEARRDDAGFDHLEEGEDGWWYQMTPEEEADGGRAAYYAMLDGADFGESDGDDHPSDCDPLHWPEPIRMSHREAEEAEVAADLRAMEEASFALLSEKARALYEAKEDGE